METVITIVFGVVGFLLLKIADKPKTFDFWFGVGAVSILYIVTDMLINVLPIRYYLGFDFTLLFAVMALFAAAKVVMITRDDLREAKAELVENSNMG